MTIPSISVALCVYGKLPFLADQLLSITSTKVDQGEIVIGDDGAEAFPWSDFERNGWVIRHFRNPERDGVLRNFEQTILKCRGELIFLSDQDDIWEEEKISRILSFFSENPWATVVFTNAFVWEDGETTARLWERVGFHPDRWNRDTVFHRMLRGNIATGSTMALRASVRGHLLPIPDEMEGVLLHDGWIAVVAASRRELGWIDLPLTKYRQHGEQELGSASRWSPRFLLRRWKEEREGGHDAYFQQLERRRAAWEKFGEICSSYGAIMPSSHIEGLSDVISFLDQRIRGGFFQYILVFLSGKYRRFGNIALFAFLRDVIWSASRGLASLGKGTPGSSKSGKK